MLIRRHFLLLSMLKTVVLLNMSVETVRHFFQDSLMSRMLTNLCNKINAVTVTFDQFNGNQRFIGRGIFRALHPQSTMGVVIHSGRLLATNRSL